MELNGSDSILARICPNARSRKDSKSAVLVKKNELLDDLTYRLAESGEGRILWFRMICRLSILLSLWALLSPNLWAGGVVEGQVTLDSMKPQPVSPGYKPQTVKPIRETEPPVAIVYLEGAGAAKAPRKSGSVRIRQNGYQFRPSILAVQTGTTIEFPNEDDEFHNVFSYSKTRRFDLGRYRKDETAKQVTFDKAGVGKIYCEIHQHMRCVVLVLDTPLFVTTDSVGRFRIKDVPPGDYSLKVFLPSEKTVASKISVKEGQTLTVKQ